MTIPDAIPFSAVDRGHRARTEHNNLEELAESIEDSGLIQPLVLVLKTPELVSQYEKEMDIVLDPTKPYLLTAGGRRSYALELLETQFLFHAATSEIGRPGFLLRSESSSFISQLVLECKENLDRDDMDWRDLLKSITCTWRIAKRQADEEGQRLLMRDFGTTLGCGYADLQIANQVYDHFIANPAMYADVTSMSGTLQILLKCTANELARVAVINSMSEAPRLSNGPAPMALTSVLAEVKPKLNQSILIPGQSPIMLTAAQENFIPLSQSFLNVNGLDFMESMSPGFTDHIICDPDYAIDVGVLDSNPNNRIGLMAQGVHQDSVESSLRDLFRFLPLAFRAIREQGFLIYWYAIDHHEKLIRASEAAGFRVQAWPNIWNKMDFRGRSNAAPNHNFPKSVEFAMICRKPKTILRKVQTSCVYTTNGSAVTKELNHPYAKPYDIWHWLYAAVAEPGQIVFDPFVGSGSSAISAITYGLRPMGTEINTDIYNHLIINLQNHYRKLLGPNVKFQ